MGADPAWRRRKTAKQSERQQAYERRHANNTTLPTQELEQQWDRVSVELASEPVWKQRKTARIAARQQMYNVRRMDRMSGRPATTGMSSPPREETPKCPPRRHSPKKSGLQKCNWKFWHEPDDGNLGPQITVTGPNGATHYLIDSETFWANFR